MFGHDDKHHEDDESQHDDGAQEVSPNQPVNDGQHGQHQDDHAQNGNADAPDNGGGDDQQAHGDNSSHDGEWQHPGEPLDQDGLGDEPEGESDDKRAPINDIVPASEHHNEVPHMPVPPRNLTDEEDDDKVPHDLIDIKQKALGQLSPLMRQLELGPEDRFRTLMMMIQANDDQTLLKQAYEAAEAIEDEKVRAQALFDIVNEITYFTQHPEN